MEVEKREVKIRKLGLRKVDKRPTRPINVGLSKFFLPEKRRRNTNRTPKFLLGGNISDPLNLHSLQVSRSVSSTLTIFFFIRRKKCTHNTETKQRTIIAMVYVNKCFNCLLLRIYRMNQRRLIRTRMSKIARTKLN